MRNWSEIQEKGQSYLAAEEQAVRERVEREQLLKTQDQEYLDRQLAEAREIAQELLKNLGAQEALEAIRDQVWGEGEIRTKESGIVANNNFEHGLTLVSNDIHIPVLEGEGKKLALHFSLHKLGLSITAHPVYTGNEPTVHLRGIGFLQRSVLEPTPNIPEDIKEHGLVQGIHLALHSSHHLRDVEKSLNPVREGAQDTFYASLVTVIKDQEKYSSFPGQIREWANSLTNQLPISQPDNPLIAGSDLREWGAKVSGAIKPVVIFQRHLGHLFY